MYETNYPFKKSQRKMNKTCLKKQHRKMSKTYSPFFSSFLSLDLLPKALGSLLFLFLEINNSDTGNLMLLSR